MKSRKSYSKEVKMDALSLVTQQNYQIAVAAHYLGICATMSGPWVKEQGSEATHAFLGNGKRSPKQQEIRRWQEERKRLKKEKEIRKKRL